MAFCEDMNKEFGAYTFSAHPV